MRTKIYFFCLVLAACAVGKSTEKVHYKVQTLQKEFPTKEIYILEIPQGYKKVYTLNEGTKAEVQYWYADSAVFYLTENLNGSALNRENLARLEKGYEQNFSAFINNDAVTFEGKTLRGFFWKERKLKSLCIGYSNVPSDRLIYFDRAIASVRNGN